MNNDHAAGLLMGIMGMLCCGGVVYLAIHAFICYLLFNDLKAIPAAHRKQEPNMVWLLMIPVFNLVWNFFVYPKISDSFKSYFDSVGRTDVGDCGKQIGLIYCIVFALSVVPYLNFLTGPAALVLLILYLVKANELKNKITPA